MVWVEGCNTQGYFRIFEYSRVLYEVKASPSLTEVYKIFSFSSHAWDLIIYSQNMYYGIFNNK